eukprot:5868927-Prymnesium_polylepis.1
MAVCAALVAARARFAWPSSGRGAGHVGRVGRVGRVGPCYPLRRMDRMARMVRAFSRWVQL